MWRIFRTVVDKPLAKATRDDGRAVVAELCDVRSATARRRMVPLVALCNLAIGEGKLTFNPLSAWWRIVTTPKGAFLSMTRIWL